MGKKSVREMSGFEQKRHSLTFKSSFGVQLMAFIVGTTILIAGFGLYFKGILYEYCMATSKLAKAEAVMLDLDATRIKTDEIIAIYDSIPEKEKGDGTSAAYQDRFDPIVDDEFRNIQTRLRIMKERVGLRNAFIVAIDEKTNRMIYLVDSDPNLRTVCPPGTWDVYTSKELDVLVHGQKVSNLYRRYGLRDRLQATITDTPAYGYRCTGGATLYETDQYTVMVCLDEKLTYMKSVSKVFLAQYVVLLMAAVILIWLISIFLIRRLMVKPINRMADAARKYTEDKNSGSTAADHFKDLGIDSGDELEELSLTMADMEESLTEYVENLTRATAEEERINTELGLAARIQEAMLPTTFPAFPDRSEFDVYASMTPAKTVGGDFYDFFLIDDDHLALMIADVAGKGIPASLFMMVSKSMLDDRILSDGSPADALEQVNSTICKGDAEDMFVTVWIGILELSTGRIVAANAGHEKPVIIHADGTAELIQDKHGFVVGGLEGVKYKNYELQIQPGDRILVYTDGVPEAETEEHEMFGLDRLLAAAGGPDLSPEETITAVRNAVDDFVGDAEQFDDLTMLCMEYKGV